MGGAVGVSAAMLDTGFKLGVDGIDDDGDRVNITAMQFNQIKTTIKSTPPLNGARVGFGLPSDFTFLTTEISADFSVNKPLVLMKNAQPDVKLEVSIAPAGVPIRWQAIRNAADHSSLGGSSNLPTVSPDNGLVTQANVNVSGSFNLRAYVDCNGSNQYEDHIDMEPSMPLNVVIANAVVVTDNSAENSHFSAPQATPAGRLL